MAEKKKPAGAKKTRNTYSEEKKQEVRNHFDKVVKANGKEHGAIAETAKAFPDIAELSIRNWIKGSKAKPAKAGAGNFLDQIALIKKKAGKLENLRSELDELISAIKSL